MGMLSQEKSTNLTSDHFWCLSATQSERVSNRVVASLHAVDSRDYETQAVPWNFLDQF